MGTSQSGRFVRSFIQLGFNQDEDGRTAYEGALSAHRRRADAAQRALRPARTRLGRPGRSSLSGLRLPVHLWQRRPIRSTGREQGMLDRCQATNTCPLIFHVATALEMWEGRQSLGLTDPLGRKDVADPVNVRTFIMASTQHGGAAAAADAEPFGICQQQPQSQSAHLDDARAARGAHRLGQGRHGAAGERARRASRTARWSRPIRCASRRSRRPTTARSRGRPCASRRAQSAARAGLRPASTSRRIPPASCPASRRASAARYGVLVPQVDADGNDVGGIRSCIVEAPIGTYTGWNHVRKDLFEDGFCSLRAASSRSRGPGRSGSTRTIRACRSRSAIRPRRPMSPSSRRRPTIWWRSASSCARMRRALIAAGRGRGHSPRAVNGLQIDRIRAPSGARIGIGTAERHEARKTAHRYRLSD